MTLIIGNHRGAGRIAYIQARVHTRPTGYHGCQCEVIGVSLHFIPAAMASALRSTAAHNGAQKGRRLVYWKETGMIACPSCCGQVRLSKTYRVDRYRQHGCRHIEGYRHIFIDCRTARSLWRVHFDASKRILLGVPGWTEALYGMNLELRQPFRKSHTFTVQHCLFHTLWGSATTQATGLSTCLPP
jgi:hypothetical protein